jgi:Tol biopolymer transport system component
MVDVFVRDRAARITSRVSLGTGGNQGNYQSYDCALSDDGQFVAFVSGADNLVPGDTNGDADVFVRDRAAGTTTRVSVATGGAEANEGSFHPAISGDGRFVAFYSWATNLVAADTNGAIDIFVHDRDTGQTSRASVATGGVQANADSNYPTISDDGRFVLFDSFATNLTPGDTNGTADVFLHDLTSGTTTRVSVADDESEGNSWSAAAEVSADGRFVTFVSGASNLVAGDLNGFEDVFVRDRTGGTTIRVSRATDGSEANARSEWPAASGNGRFFAFASLASNLVQSDTNNAADVFLHDRGR